MKIGGLIVLSEYGQRRIAKFPSQSKIHNPENTMHQLLDAMGEYNDYLEDLLFKHEEKKDLRTNYSDEDESEEDYILGFHMLNLIGECYKIVRYPNESNNDFRARILSIIDNDGGISSLKNIISKILRIDKNLVEVIENEMSYFTVGDVLDSRIESVNSKPLISRITNIEQQLVVNIPQGYDTSILEDSLKNCVLADVKILINPSQTPPPSIPVVSVTNITSDSVVVSFSSTNTNSYDIYLNDVLIANTANTSYNLTDLSTSTTYTVKIVANGNGTAENTKTFTTSDPVMELVLDNAILYYNCAESIINFTNNSIENLVGATNGTLNNFNSSQLNNGELSFNGTNYIDTGLKHNVLQNGFSIEAVINSIDRTATIENRGFVGDHAPPNPGFCMFQFDATGEFYSGIWSSSQDNRIILPHNIIPTDFTHFTAIYDGSVLKLYINGILVGSKSVSNLTLSNTYNIMVGRSGANSGNYWKNKFKSIIIHNRALSETEILNNKTILLGD